MNLQQTVEKCVTLLKAGGVILYPTDTVWGVGCDAANERAVQRVFDLKQRAAAKSMILLIENPAAFQPYTHADMQRYTSLLTENTIPQTVIIPDVFGLASNVLPPEKTAAVRCPKHRFCQALLHAFQKPLVSTSANISGETPARALSDVSPQIYEGVDFVVPSIFDTHATGKASRIICINAAGGVDVLR